MLFPLLAIAPAQTDHPDLAIARCKNKAAWNTVYGTETLEALLVIISARILKKLCVIPCKTLCILQPVTMSGMIAGDFVEVTFNLYVFLYA
jgi:hypothetical protein